MPFALQSCPLLAEPVMKIDFDFMKSMRYTDFGMKDWGSLPEEWRGIPIERQQSLLSLMGLILGNLEI
jgi:hypothetical protein